MGPLSLLLVLLHAAVMPVGDSSAAGSTSHEEITVTATGVPTRLADVPAAVTVLDADELAMAPAVALDDVLRQVPGFTLFRRSGSRSANPTTQGPSLRGVGGSGASRALVLADDVPLNDPFGGWVAWGRVPRLELDRVETLRGGASDLYGTGALAGVVQLLRRPIAGDAGLVELSGGNQRTASADLWASARRGAWGAAVAAERFTSEGYVLVPEAQRGLVDTPAGGGHTSVDLTLAHDGDESAGRRLFVRGSTFREGRENGTPLQWNSTRLDEVSAGADLGVLGGSATARGWWTRERYLQTFSAVAPDRDSERLQRDQVVPSRQVGALLRLSHPLGAQQTLLAGVEARRTTGESDERSFAGPSVTTSANGGRQALEGAFVEDLVALGPRLSLALGVRGDVWRNDQGPARPAPAGGTTSRDASALSPRLALRFQASPSWSLAASAYRSFRAPSLNELYRSFRVGDTVTQANAALAPERLRGAELGAGWQPIGVRGGPRLRATFFWLQLDDPIANVTIGAIPGATVRQRQNLGQTHARGLELEGETGLGGGFTLGGSFVAERARVTSFAADPTLVGREVPQVPARSGALRLLWAARGWSAMLVARHGGAAFEDDLNTLPLDAFTTVDVELARRVGLVDLFVAAENLLDADYVVARTPIENDGAPRLVRAGVRLRLLPSPAP